jgi:hypothetical protein
MWHRDAFEKHATKKSEIGDVEKQDLVVMMKRLEVAKVSLRFRCASAARRFVSQVKLNEKAHGESA